MSGASRALRKTSGAICFASAWLAALCRMADRFSRPRMNSGMEAWYMDRGMR
ncbi:hypothetical protein D3C78_1787570 [compost metagenome]